MYVKSGVHLATLAENVCRRKAGCVKTTHKAPQITYVGWMAKKPKDSQKEQSKRFIEMARELEVDETEAEERRVFGTVGMKRPKASKKNSGRS